MKTKRIASTFTAIFLCLCLLTAVSLHAYAESDLPISLDDCVVIDVDENGNITPASRIAISHHTILPGRSMHYCTSNGTYFILDKDWDYTISLSCAPAADLGIGYYNSTVGEVITGTITGTEPSGIVQVPEFGQYVFVIHNNSTSSVSIKSGHIS